MFPRITKQFLCSKQGRCIIQPTKKLTCEVLVAHVRKSNSVISAWVHKQFCLSNFSFSAPQMLCWRVLPSFNMLPFKTLFLTFRFSGSARRRHCSSSGGDKDAKQQRLGMWMFQKLCWASFWGKDLFNVFAETPKESTSRVKRPAWVKRELVNRE